MPLSEPSFSEEEIRAVCETLRSGWWTMGPETQQLESEFADYLGVRHAVAVANGTAALQLALHALGLERGDEVVTPSLTFVAAANSILHAGGIPHFADVVSPHLPLVGVETLENAITPITRGICVMHYGGFPCAMDEVMDFARRRNLWVIEDAAHAPGACWKGIRCGAWGDLACFSFFGNKNLTCAEGGLVVTGRDDLAQKLRALRSHGMSSLTWDRYQGHKFSYDVTMPGFNYRMDDLRASLLRVQLRSLDEFNRLRRERVGWYRQALSGDSRWTIPFVNHDSESAHHLFTIVLNEGVLRQEVISKLRTLGIQTSVHYPPIHRFSFYRECSSSAGNLKNTDYLGQRILTLPLFPGMTREQLDLVCVSLLGASIG